MKHHTTTTVSLRRTILVASSLLAAGTALLALQWLSASPAQAQPGATTRYVAPIGSDPSNTCANSSTPCRTVQHAVDEAQPGDEIRVAAGIYTSTSVRAGISQVVYISKTVTIRGGYTITNSFADPPDPDRYLTVLNAEGQGRVMVVTGLITVAINGLHITGGDTSWLGCEGGGIYVHTASGTISDCTIQANWATQGAGLYLHNSHMTLTNNAVQDNHTTEGAVFDCGFTEGGGGYLDHSTVTLISNTIRNNVAIGAPYGWSSGSGGGLYANDSDVFLISNTLHSNWSGIGGGLHLTNGEATLTGNIVENNEGEQAWGGEGGGLYANGTAITLTNNVVQHNSAGGSRGGGGGGLSLRNCLATLDANVIKYNSFGMWGGGEMCCFGGGILLSGSTATLINTVIADNLSSETLVSDDSGVYIEASSVDLLHTTIARNHGGGIYVRDSTISLTNTILVSHTVGISITSGSTATLEATLWGSDAWANQIDWDSEGVIITGTRNYWENPGFADPGSEDYHIGVGSAARDSGVPTGVTADMDGEPRDAVPDLGADEWWSVAALKRVAPSTARPGEIVTYTIVLNNGTDAAMNVCLTDTLPVQVDYLGPLAYDNGTGGYASGVVTWTGTVYTTTSTTIYWPVQLTSNIPCNRTITNTAAVSDTFRTFCTDITPISVLSCYDYLPLVLRNE